MVLFINTQRSISHKVVRSNVVLCQCGLRANPLISVTETLERTQAILQQLKDQIRKGIPIIGGGAGTGISAKFEEAGGIDLIVVYNSGRFRMAGRGSLAGLLPFGDANAIVLDMANEVLPVSFNRLLVIQRI